MSIAYQPAAKRIDTLEKGRQEDAQRLRMLLEKNRHEYAQKVELLEKRTTKLKKVPSKLEMKCNELQKRIDMLVN